MGAQSPEISSSFGHNIIIEFKDKFAAFAGILEIKEHFLKHQLKYYYLQQATQLMDFKQPQSHAYKIIQFRISKIEMQATDQEKTQADNQLPPSQSVDSEATGSQQTTKKEEDVQEIKSQLKQKLKQNKILSAKNSKLQTKYVQLFRQHKALKKDYQVFVNVLEEVIPEFEKKQLGSYDGEILKTKWHQKQSRTSQKIQQMIQQASMEKSELEKKIKSEMQQKIRNIDLESQIYLEGLNKDLVASKKQNKSMSEQLLDLDKKLDLKDIEVSKMTKEKLKLQHLLNQYKVKEISDELGGVKNEQQEKTINERNQFLALRQQVDNLMDKRDKLRAELKEAKLSIENLQSELKKKNGRITELEKQLHGATHQKSKLKAQLSQKNSRREETWKQQIQQTKHSPTAIERHEEDQNIHHFSMDDEYVHREYVKNLFIRYLKCYRNGDSTQANILENIILTILKFSIGERQQINIKKKGWF